MPSKWRSTTWGEEISLEYGKGLRGYQEAVGQFRVYGTNGPVGWTSQPLASGPGVILGRKGAYRGVHYSTDPFFVIDTAYYVVPKTPLDMRWLYYAIKHYKLGEIDDGSPIPSTTRAAVYVMGLEVPPLPEQRAIAGVLGALDDKIELNRRTSRTLEKLARAIFRAWFVDFEPVKAKAAGARSFPSMPQEAFDALPTRLVPSELGPIPEGWEAKLLSDLCTVGRGASPRPINEYMNGEVPWVKIADATAANGPFLYETKEKLKTSGVSKSVKVSPGDLILSNSATCGLPIFVEFDGCIHDGWLYFKNLRSISKTYLFHILIELANHLIHIADGSVQKNLNTKLVGQQKVLVPTESIPAAFDNFAVVCFGAIRQNGVESRKLAALRDYLLPKLLSGEVRVADAQDVVSEVD